MYGKIFEEIFRSSLMFNEGWKAVYVFSSMVVLADENGNVTHDERSLYRMLGLESDGDFSFEAFVEILKNLAAPDEFSNINDYDGKRIMPLKEVTDGKVNRGWWIVNYEYYRMKGSKADRQYQNRINKRRQRERQKMSANVSSGQRRSAMSAHTDTDTDTDINTRNAECFAFPSKSEIQTASKEKIESWLDHICKELKTSKFPSVFQFKNKALKIGINKKAILHTLIQVQKKNGFDKKGGVWAYATNTLKVEDGNYNEADHKASHEQIKAREKENAKRFAELTKGIGVEK